MKSKKIICGAVAAAMTLSVAFSGCGLLATNNDADMKQTVATVNITKSDKLDKALSEYSSAVETEVIIKRDLVNAFINVGSSYISSGYSYEDVFNMLMDELTNNAVLVQYATMYVLKNKNDDSDSGVTLDGYTAKTTHIEKLTYLLGGDKSQGVLEAQYKLYTSLNNALDSYEKTKEDDEDEYVGSGTRTTPINLNATVDDYLPLTDGGDLDYGVYTGYEGYLLTDAGTYEPKDNTNRNTRRKAYAQFLKNVEKNYLITKDDTDTTDILKLTYVQSQYENQLEQSVLNEFYDICMQEQEDKIANLEGDEYDLVKKAYDNLLEEQKQTNSKTADFESTIGKASDTSFILYAPSTKLGDSDDSEATFGYVYNILLPFSTSQNNRLTKLQSYRTSKVIDDSAYFAERNKLLKEITTTDQRSAWLNGETDYSFNVATYNDENPDNAVEHYYAAVKDGSDYTRDYLFFENNVTKTGEYKPLKNYIGQYTYNGKVTPNKDGSYTLIPEKLTIDDMLEEFSAYINYVLDPTGSGNFVEMHAGDTMSGGDDYSVYYDTTNFLSTEAGKEKEIDYSLLVYATGQVYTTSSVKLGETPKADMYVRDTDRYKATAAVNELQFAYTTDTSVLSQYIGYTVGAYETKYIKEFEYAAQQALKMGAGAFKVCAGDYGWHLIYVTDSFSFEGGEVYSVSFTKERVEQEGTFENMFYEWYKNTSLTNETTQRRTEILELLSNDKTITKYKKVYKDLLEIG